MPGLNDVILVYFDDQPSLFARIEAIEPDIKKNWYHVTLLLLTIPTQTVKWILRDEYINGSPFTMGGRPVRLEGVKPLKDLNVLRHTASLNAKKTSSESGTVIPFKKPKKK